MELEGHTLPAKSHVEKLLAFVRRWDQATPLLIHCWTGVSRSTAAARASGSPSREQNGEMVGIGPKDELEGMMAAQLIAAHNAAMECYRRAMIGDQTFEGRRENLSQANKLSRTYAALIDALNRHRGKGQQTVRFEHVTVQAGGQAIVGNVETPGGGDRLKSEEQSHAITYAPGIEMPSQDQERSTVPSTSHVANMSHSRWHDGAYVRQAYLAEATPMSAECYAAGCEYYIALP
jgi:hypothetical protein